MKKFFKKVPAIIIVSLIIVITVAFAVVATNINSVEVWLDYYINGDENSPLTDLDGDEKITILDAIAFHNNLTVTQTPGFTKGIY